MIIPSAKDKLEGGDDSKTLVRSASVATQPPSYDDVTRDTTPARDHVVVVRDRRRPFVRALSRTTPAPTPGPSTERAPLSPKTQSPSSAGSSPTSWLNRTLLGNASSKSAAQRPSEGSGGGGEPPSPRSQAEVRTTVLGLVRDLVASASSGLGASVWTDGGLASRGVLDSCVVVCARQQVSLASILQERSVESHVPAYWAIVQRPPSAKEQAADDALMRLLALSAPLTPYTVYELRLACLATHANHVLQRIRTSPAVFPLSGTDGVLLRAGDSAAPTRGFRDVVEVMEGGGREVNEGAFSVRLELELFQRRMRVSNLVQVEFVARGRIWSLVFFVVPAYLPHPYIDREDEQNNNFTAAIPQAAYTALRMLPKPLAPGSWACCLSLRAGSPECWVDGRITVREPDPATAYERRGSHDERMAASMQKPLPALRRPSTSAIESGAYGQREHEKNSQSELLVHHHQPGSLSAEHSPYNASFTELPSASPKNPEPGSGYTVPRGGLPAFTMPPDVNPFRSALSSPANHLTPPPQHPLRSTPSTPSLISTLTPSNYSSASSKLASMTMSMNWRAPTRTSSGSKFPLTLRLRCTHGPLVAPPPPAYTALPLSLLPSAPPLVTNTLGGAAEMSKSDARRARKQAKRDAKVRAARAKRARAGKETKKEKVELGAEAHTVVVVGLGEEMDGKGDGRGGMGKLMYDNCSYIAQDGFLRATFEAKLGKPESECIIC